MQRTRQELPGGFCAITPEWQFKCLRGHLRDTRPKTRFQRLDWHTAAREMHIVACGIALGNASAMSSLDFFDDRRSPLGFSTARARFGVFPAVALFAPL